MTNDNHPSPFGIDAKTNAATICTVIESVHGTINAGQDGNNAIITLSRQAALAIK